jgi:hypothetical protein
MRKTLVLLTAVAVLALAGVAFAGTAHDNTGCGLGTQAWGNGADGSTVSQSLQATTNGTFGNQTFGITSGTSDCKRPSSFVENEKLNEFVAANMDSLAKDISAGRGETLDAMSELMKVDAANKAAFYARLKGNFAVIFPSSKVEYSHVVDTIYYLAS